MPEPRRELDAAVAREVMGLTVTQGNSFDWIATHPVNGAGLVVSPYSALQDCSSRVENEIERRGLADLYIHYLMPQVGIDGHKPGYDERDLFAIRRATPEQICRAALKAVRGSGNDPAHQLS